MGIQIPIPRGGRHGVGGPSESPVLSTSQDATPQLPSYLPAESGLRGARVHMTSKKRHALARCESGLPFWFSFFSSTEGKQSLMLRVCMGAVEDRPLSAVWRWESRRDISLLLAERTSLCPCQVLSAAGRGKDGDFFFLRLTVLLIEGDMGCCSPGAAHDTDLGWLGEGSGFCREETAMLTQETKAFRPGLVVIDALATRRRVIDGPESRPAMKAALRTAANSRPVELLHCSRRQDI
jgi:hypothetical protein